MTFEIDLSQLINNFRILKKDLHDIAACVKSDAYGFGLEKITKALYDEGCRTFCVANVFEGIELRKVCPNLIEIICLNGFISNYHDLYANFNITPAIISLEQWFQILEFPIKYWGFVDTGLNRSGLTISEFEQISTDSKLIGIMSHFLHTNIENEDQEQMKKIDELLKKYPKFKRSILKSSAINLRDKYKDMARIGHALYFKTHENSLTNNIGKIYSEIIKISDIKTGDFVGYDKEFQAKHDMKIALVNCGYADGIDKNHPYFLINGKKCPVLGKISMDLTVIDISNLTNIKIGQKVDIFGNFLEIANEIHCSLGYLTTKIHPIKIKKHYFG